MNANICNNCGGEYEYRHGRYVCRACGAYKQEEISNEEVTLLYTAYQKLRLIEFSDAEMEFDDILRKYPKNPNAYWGRLMAKYGIKYEQDLDGRMLPTCYATSIESVLAASDYKKALQYADDENKAYYKEQAEYIERVRKEWIEKANKEKPYDIFICFKDSDRENGIERTQDSVDAQDLYNALTAEGYRVFFSRVSLRDKVAEQYEPYIYSAISTAKVMIVFGEKPEYFSAVWLKNEWTRFAARIASGEKHKNSLVVVYKNMNPGDLPAVLRTRQCLNMADMTFLSNLNRHVGRVIEESKQPERLDRIEIKGGQVARKAKKLDGNYSIHMRELGEVAVAETDISEQQTLGLAKSYMNGGQWEDADKLVDDLIFNNPTYSEAIWTKWLIRHRVKTGEEILKRIPAFKDEDFHTIEQVLNCASKSFAMTILDLLYRADQTVSEEGYQRVLETILPYNYRRRNARIKAVFGAAIEKDYFGVFNMLLTMLPSKDVDTYIAYNLLYANHTRVIEHKKACLQSVLNVDEGNMGALWACFEMKWDGMWGSVSAEELTESFENLLKYSSDPNIQIGTILYKLSGAIERPENSAFAKQFFKYYNGDEKEMLNALIAVSHRMIEGGFFEDAQYLLGLALSKDKKNAEIYWLLCLVKTKSKNNEDILCSKIPLKSIPEYTKYLTMVGETERQERIALAKKQEQEQKSRRSAKKKTKIIVTIYFVLILIGCIAIFGVARDQSLRNGVVYEKSDSGDSYIVSDYEGSATEISILSEYNGLPVTSIGERAFKGCGELTSITIPDSVTSIGSFAFEGCSGLTSVTIPDSVTSIGSYAFYDCSSLTSITIPDSVMSIGYSAFSGCSSLESVTIGNGVIGDKAFYDCSSLASVTIGNGVTSIGSYAFYDCRSLTSVTIGNGVTSIGDCAFYQCSSLKNLKIPDSVTSIGWYAFDNCRSLTSVTIPDSVTSIGGSAFYNCNSLTSVVIGNGVTSLGDGAFKACSSLTSITIPDSVTSIGSSVFSGCSSLTSIIIPDSVTSIGFYAFYNCDGLTSVTIGDGVTSISSYAFYNCDGLTRITFNGTIAELNEISKGSNWHDNIPATKVICSDGEVDI